MHNLLAALCTVLATVACLSAALSAPATDNWEPSAPSKTPPVAVPGRAPIPVHPISKDLLTLKTPLQAKAPLKINSHYKTARAAVTAVRLQLDKAFYEIGDKVSAKLSFASIDPKEDYLVVHVVSDAKDVEAVLLKKVAPGRYETMGSNTTVARQTKTPNAHDGKLETRAGGRIVGVVFIDPKNYPVGANVIADVAIAGTNASALAKQQLAPGAISEEERAAQQTSAPFGLLMARGGLPLEVALGQVIFTPNGMADMKAFLEYSGGKIIGRQQNGGDAKISNSAVSYLVSVPPRRARVDRLPDLRNLFAEKDDVIATQQATLQTYALILEYRLKGFAVSANPRLRQHGVFATTETATGILGPSMQLTNGAGAACAPDDVTCPINTPRLWAHVALWDLDSARVPVAFVDQGFATAGPDFRRPAGGTFRECDFERFPAVCAPGVANTPPTVGANLVGDRVWHGTGSVSTAGAVLNNSWMPGAGAAGFNGGSAGPGGQVLVPMMYRMGLGSYAFQMGAAVTRATDDGAACINIAAGYPCNVKLTLVGDFELCNPAARAGACAALIGAASSAAVAATGAACGGGGLLGAILDIFAPGVGSAIAATTCTTATAAAATSIAATVTACTALVALGDVSGPMQAGVNHATERGVPVIASMGNQFNAAKIPAELRPFIDAATLSFDGNRLRIIPATLPPVIAIGAATVTGGAWVNHQVRGASVVVWAPEINPYLSPAIGAATPTGAAGFTTTPSHDGTSAASSYVTGVVAAMQAANPLLNPNTSTLSAAQRRSIPRSIARILRTTANQMGTGTAEPARLPMVDPWRALRSAWGAWPAGFEDQMNFDETGADDTAAGARALVGPRMNGTIIAVPGAGGGAPTLRDVDFYRATPAPSSVRGATFRVTLRFPEVLRGANAGRLELVGEGWTPAGDTVSTTGSGATRTRIRSLSFVSTTVARGASSTFQIRGVGDEDNVYTLDVGEFPMLEPDRFDRDTADNVPASRPNNNSPAHAVPIGVPGGLAWPAGALTQHLVVPNLNFHDSADEDWFLFAGYPPGAGSRVCRHLDMAWNASLRIEIGDGVSMEELLPVTVTDGPHRGERQFSITNPPTGLYVRVTHRPGATDLSYALDITHSALALPSGLGVCH